MLFFLLLILLPVPEIWTIISLGKAIGTGWTILLLLGTMAAGVLILRAQGMSLLHSLTTAVLGGGSMAQYVMAEGVLRTAAGMLLLIPGFLTDFVAIPLLIPPVRRALARMWVRDHAAPVEPTADPVADSPRVIEGESRRVGD